ncbi:MAG: leucine-rich repeat domain-containing protein [Bacteroidales bacterium]|nr:leucine-rich repeat domain-containing protein [Bacteroidales bacterium]
MKRLAFFIILILCCTMAKAQGEIHNPNDPNFVMKNKAGLYLQYTITSKESPSTVTINGIKGNTDNLKKLEIPETVHYLNTDFAVTVINKAAFSNISTLTSVTIPKTVTEIKAEAFNGCTALKTIKIGGIIEYCGKGSFCGTAISKPIYTGKNLVYYPANLAEYKINEGTEKVLEYAFSDCKEMSAIIIPASVKIIYAKTFANCDKLESIVVADGNQTFDSRNNCNAIILTSENKVVKGCKNSTIPNGIKTIGHIAFANTSISKIEIPGSVTTIEDSAFYNTELTNVTIPESVSKIGASAFVKNKKLAVVNFNASNCEPMDEKYPVFEQCMSLTSVNFGDNVKVIPAYSFKDCTELRYATLSNSVEKIGMEAFKDCSSLSFIEIPMSVKKVESKAFYKSGIYEPVYNENMFIYYAGNDTEYKIPDGIKVISETAFYENETLKSITIPNSVIRIDDYAFNEAKALENITIPNSVKEIGPNAFRYCVKLKSITLPNAITTIENETFLGCVELKSITLPNSVEYIGNNILYWCDNLESVTLPKSIKSMDKYALNGNQLKYINIPKGTMSQFKSMLNPEYHSKLREK